jgi:hypothetical protein
MPRLPADLTMQPEARRREIATILATAMVRLQLRPGALNRTAGKSPKSSPTRLANGPSASTHVTVREAFNANKEDSA